MTLYFYTIISKICFTCVSHFVLYMRFSEKPATFKNDVREPSNIDGFYLFKALCKKILGRTDYIAQDHSLIAKGDVMTMNNVSRAIPPDLILSNQVITALQTQSIKPQCEFVVSILVYK